MLSCSHAIWSWPQEKVSSWIDKCLVGRIEICSATNARSEISHNDQQKKKDWKCESIRKVSQITIVHNCLRFWHTKIRTRTTFGGGSGKTRFTEGEWKINNFDLSVDVVEHLYPQAELIACEDS